MNKKEVLKRIGKKNWLNFCEFMQGQTVGTHNGETDYYECDVENFMSPKKKRFFD